MTSSGLGLLLRAAGAWAAFPETARAAGGTVNFADIGVGDPGGDWSLFTKAANGWNVNLVAIGNAPSAILNVLVAGGGTASYDVINIVGGMQKPLVDNDLIEPLDTTRLPAWSRDRNIAEFLGKGTPGFNFIGYQDKLYGVPTVLQGDSFAFLPEKTGPLDSYAALFDPKFKGYVALEDNYTTAGQKTALYLKHANLAKIENPADMTPEELKTVVDFLIEQKRKGQFRVIWSSFQQAVDLIVNKEVYVIDCWEPMVFVAKSKGVNAVYADPKEGYLLWAMAAYLTKNPKRSAESDPGRVCAPRFHARRLVRRQDHSPARLYDEHRCAGLRQGPSRSISRRSRREGGRHHRERASQIRPGRHVAESLAEARRRLRDGMGAL